MIASMSGLVIGAMTTHTSGTLVAIDPITNSEVNATIRADVQRDALNQCEVGGDKC